MVPLIKVYVGIVSDLMILVMADLDGTIFAFDYRMQLAYTTISIQILLVKSDLRHHHDRFS